MLVVVLLVVATIPISVHLLRGPLARVRSTLAICIATRSLLRRAEEAPSAYAGATSDLGSLLPDGTTVASTPYPDVQWPTPAAVANGRSDASVWIAELTHDHYERGLWREWQATTGGLLQTEVLQFDSHVDALAFQDWVISGSCFSATDVFGALSVQEGIGLRLNWPNGDVSDQVSFVRGSRRYLAAFRAGSPPPRAVVLSLCADLARVAR
jgi:hypothetical protein